MTKSNKILIFITLAMVILWSISVLSSERKTDGAISDTVETQTSTEQMNIDAINATMAGDYSAMISDVSGLGPAMVTVELSPMSPLAGPGARASLTIDYVDIGISSVWKIGGWNISKDNVVVTLSGTTEQEFNKPEIIEFIFQKDTLVAVNYDESIYGEKGLQLQRPVVIELQGTTTGEIGRRPI